MVGMARHHYKLRTHEIGQRLVAFRNQTGLTQTELGRLIGVSRRSILKWEGGEGVPNGTHLHHLLEVFVDRKAFTAGQELAEARALWEAVSQAATKRLGQFNTHWFEQLLSGNQGRRSEDPPTVRPQHVALSDHDVPDTRGSPDLQPSPVPAATFIDWGEAIDVPSLYGREAELTQLQQWVLADRCRVVTLLGLGGVGKTSLALSFVQHALPHFDAVLFRSVHNGPSLAELLDQTIRAVSDQQVTSPEQLPDKIALLIQLFRERRCLIILDNFEAILQPGTLTGTYRTGYGEYGSLLRALSERAHQSCLLLTSREKPSELGPQEGRSAPVRTMHLAGLDDSACQSILEAKEIVATATDLSALARLYGGNPLALALVAEPIRELFGGDVGAFLVAGDAFFNGVGKLLQAQFARSTPLEQAILRWLAVERELVPLSALLVDIGDGVPQRELLVALESLRHRMLIERGPSKPAFTLQPVILEYVTDQLVETICQEIGDRRPRLLHSHALMQAPAKDYIRHSQERLIATPLLERLTVAHNGMHTLEHKLLTLLASWREQPPSEQGYGPGNIVNLLRLLRGNLRGLDLSHLALRSVYLQRVEMQDVLLNGVTIRDSSFTETFDVLLAVAVSGTGTYWAAASRRGELQVWSVSGLTLHPMWRVYDDMGWGLAFSPDGSMLASSGSWDGTLKLWDVASGTLRWVGRHTSHAASVAFAPDGRMLASGGGDATVRIWDIQSGAQLQELPHPSPVSAVAWSPNGRLLASGDVEGSIRLWDMQATAPTTCICALLGHTAWVDGLSFAPDGGALASASWDGTVKVWDVASGQLRETLTGHTDRVSRVAWSPDGRILASSSRDQTLWLWEVATGSYRGALYGHTAGVVGLAFLSDSSSLVSASEDGTLRVWDVANRQCMRVIQGHTSSLFDVDWSPDSTQLVCGSADTLVTIYDLSGETLPRVLGGHHGVVLGVGWNADGRYLASSEWDNVVRLWDSRSGACLQVLQHPDDAGNFFQGVAWSPDGQRLACGTYRNGIHIFEMTADRQYWVGPQFQTWIRQVAWHPDATCVAGAGEDGTIYLWDAVDGTLMGRLAGHHGTINCVTWSTDGTKLASGGSGGVGGELFVWDAQRGKRMYALAGHPRMVNAVAWGSSEDVLISGDSEGILRWWNIRSGTCIQLREAHQGAIQSLRRSPEGTKLASCGDDGAIRLWDLQTGTYLQTLRRDRPYERMDISGLSGITPAQRASLIALGAVDATEV
jgi:WD40 repeat protein/transcriptional regulator with XRE-family HTH domain